ncbi:MAG: Tfp pilus assembly protein FimT/FimU [Dehalococcoidia bacterium]
MSRRATRSGFTLLELMVVVTIIAATFALVPMSMDSWGARSRLEASANSLVAALGQARTQAIYDGWPAYLELGYAPDADDKDEDRFAFRIRFTSQVSTTQLEASDPDERRRLAAQLERERTDLWTEWDELPDGLVLVGISDAKGEWQKPSREKPFEIGFSADGNAMGAVAIRIEASNMEVRREFRTATITLNALTSLATWSEGELELERKRPASEFRR